MITLFVLVLLSTLAAGLAWGMLFVLKDAHRQSSVVADGAAVWDEPVRWSALDDHQLDRLLREAAQR